MIVYENLQGKSVNEILAANWDTLRTEARVLLYAPESKTTVILTNVFDCPCITVKDDKDIEVPYYIQPSEADDTFDTIVKNRFSGCIYYQYSEWLLFQRRKSDEDKTRQELIRFIKRCGTRTLSESFKSEIKARVLAI